MEAAGLADLVVGGGTGAHVPDGGHLAEAVSVREVRRVHNVREGVHGRGEEGGVGQVVEVRGILEGRLGEGQQAPALPGQVRTVGPGHTRATHTARGRTLTARRGETPHTEGHTV